MTYRTIQYKDPNRTQIFREITLRFESIEDAEYAQKKLNRTRLGDKMLHVDFAQGDRKSKIAASEI